MIKKVFGFLLHPIFLTLLALLIIGVLVWWIGPLVAIGTWTPLVSELSRAILIGIVVLLVVLRIALSRWRARRASHHLTEGLTKAPAGKADEPENAEQKILNTRFAEAVASLRKMRLHAAGKKPGWRDWISLSSGSYFMSCPGMSSSARLGPAKPPRWSIQACLFHWQTNSVPARFAVLAARAIVIGGLPMKPC